MVQCKFCVCFHYIKQYKKAKKINITPYGENFYQLRITYWDKI